MSDSFVTPWTVATSLLCPRDFPDGASGAQIGRTDQTHVNIYSNAMEITDNSATPITFFKVRDAVDENGQVVDSFNGDGSQTTFSLTFTAVDANYTVTVNGVTASPTKTTTNFTFTTAPEDGDVIIATYDVEGHSAKGYDFGVRGSGYVSEDTQCSK